MNLSAANLNEVENLLKAKIAKIASTEDPAHDQLHFIRVVQTAKALCRQEGARYEVVMPAAWGLSA